MVSQSKAGYCESVCLIPLGLTGASKMCLTCCLGTSLKAFGAQTKLLFPWLELGKDVRFIYKRTPEILNKIIIVKKSKLF